MEICVSKRKRVQLALLAILLSAVMIFCSAYTPVLAASDSDVIIGQASANERWGTKGGKAGDQTGSEVAFDYWTYSKKNGNYNNWKYVFRAKDPKTARKLAAKMRAICNNDNIGYDKKWPDRVSLYDQAKSHNWLIDKINKKCETTCTQAVSVCLIACGFDLPRYWDATMVYDDLKKTGKFTIFKGSSHCASDKLLEPGDILLSPGSHAAIVVKSPNAAGSEAKAKAAAASGKESGKRTVKRIKYKIGKEYYTTKVLNVRTGPGLQYKNVLRENLSPDGKLHATKSRLGRLRAGTEVTCLKVKGNWMRIPSGWICCKPGNIRK